MNYQLEDLQKELDKSKAEFEVAISSFIEALRNFNDRLERAEKCIIDLKKRMLH